MGVIIGIVIYFALLWLFLGFLRVATGGKDWRDR